MAELQQGHLVQIRDWRFWSSILVVIDVPFEIKDWLLVLLVVVEISLLNYWSFSISG